MKARDPAFVHQLAAERVAALARSARTIAHELGNPVTGIGLQIEILRRRLRGVDVETAAPLLRAIEQIAAATARVTELTTRLRDYARLAVGEREDIDLRELVAAAVGESGLGVTVEGEAPVTLRGDAKLLRCLVDALIENAAQATTDEGNTSVTVEASASEAILVISDSGPGMPSADVDRATALAFSGWRKPGFGLSVAERIAVLHGGTLSVRSAEPHGLVVEVRLALPAD